MRREKGIVWVLGVPFVVVALVAVILYQERPAQDGITRAAACKAAALFLTTADGCRTEAETEQSFFSAADQRQWYVKYMDWLYRRGLLSEELTPPSAGTAEGLLTYEEAARLADRLAEAAWGDGGTKAGGDLQEKKSRLAGIVGRTARNRKKPVPAERFWEMYGELCRPSAEAADGSGQEKPADTEPDGGVKEVVLQIAGTPDNTDGTPAWTAYTDQGTYGFEGLGMSRYLDCRIRALAKDRELIRVIGIVSGQVCYRNVWIIQVSDRAVTGFTGDCVREFSVEKELAQAGDLEGQLADLELSGGRVERIALKRERITAKVLAVREDAVELEGYGEIPLDEDFCVYKVYGDLQRQDLSQILVGYDTQEFVVADGKLCAALTVRSFGAETIRVLITDTGFHSVFHPQIRLEFLCGGIMRQGEKETVFHAGESMTLKAGTGGEAGSEDGAVFCSADERTVFCPSDESVGIRIASVIREQGEPVCPGRLEVSCEEEGLVLVNELYVEDYLKRVLPSEMPLSYEPEALRAQAVCARTYAYRQIRANSCRRYGAHVDDSTNYQVYNNSGTGREAAEAVDATYGQILTYGGEAAETYYFSTSCGHTTDMGAWGQEPERTPYLHAVEVRPDGGGTWAGSAVDAAGGMAEKIAAENGGLYAGTKTDAAGGMAEKGTVENGGLYAGTKTDAAGGMAEKGAAENDGQYAGMETDMNGSADGMSGSSEAEGEEAFAAFIRSDGSGGGQTDYEASCRMYRWQTRITAAQLQENLPGTGTVTDVAVVRRGAGGAAQCVSVTGSGETEEIEGESRIRAALGHPDCVVTCHDGSTQSGLNSLPSAFISVEGGAAEDGTRYWDIYGGGYGHGIGMSQNGAQAMAKRGWGYVDILNFFYEGTRIESVY